LNYRRVSALVNYIFYKTSLIVWTLLLFGCYSVFSGTFLYLDWAYQAYNVAFTAIPIIVFAVLDRDLDPVTLMKYPKIYTLTLGAVLFNYPLFALWMFWAFLHGLIAFFFPWYAFNNTTPEPGGQSFGLWSAGLAVYTAVCFIANLKVTILFASLTWLHWVSLFGSIFVYFVTMSLMSATTFFEIGGADYYWVLYRIIATAPFWFSLIGASCTAFMLDFVWEGAQRMFFPTPTIICQEAERLGLDLTDILSAHKRELDEMNIGPKRFLLEKHNSVHTGFDFSHTPEVRKVAEPANKTSTFKLSEPPVKKVTSSL